MDDKCKVDLSKHDIYKGFEIPDEHVEITLKVLRTLRNQLRRLGRYADADSLTPAHATIVRCIEEIQAEEAKMEGCNGT